MVERRVELGQPLRPEATPPPGTGKVSVQPPARATSASISPIPIARPGSAGSARSRSAPRSQQPHRLQRKHGRRPGLPRVLQPKLRPAPQPQRRPGRQPPRPHSRFFQSSRPRARTMHWGLQSFGTGTSAIFGRQTSPVLQLLLGFMSTWDQQGLSVRSDGSLLKQASPMHCKSRFPPIRPPGKP